MAEIDICNQALGHLGEVGKLTTLNNPGSTPQETHCARLYDTARDFCLIDMEPKFATRKQLLVLHDADEEDVVLTEEWTYAYARPTGLLKLLKVLPISAAKNRPSEDYDLFSWLPDAATPDSTDNAADTVTFADAHGWVSGTVVSPLTTNGGLTAGTLYYVNKVDEFTVSFHLTLAAALAGTSKVAITSVTVSIVPQVAEQVIVTNVDEAWADFVYQITDTGLFTAHFNLALSYKLASLLANPVIKGKTGLQLTATMEQMYMLYRNKEVAADKRNEQISEQYKTHVPSFLRDR